MSLPRIDGDSDGSFAVAAAPLTTAFTMLSVTGAAEQPVTATLSYATHEPFLVRATFRLADARTVDWVLSRDLLRDGTLMAAGLGDIRFFPGDDGLLLELRSHEGRAFLYGDLAPLAAFVARIFAAVPAGAEGRFYCLDDELAQLLTASADPDRYRTDWA